MATLHEHYRIAILPSPGPSVHGARTAGSKAPPLFHDALYIRMEVFVKEQGCNVEEDIDADDAISWHWVLFTPGEDGKEEPAATIRLIPASNYDHGHDALHSAEVAMDQGGGGAKLTEPNYASSDGLWDGKERYAMIGRLATVRAFRGRGFGKVLEREALQWASKHPVEVGRGGEWDGLMMAHAQTDVESWYRALGWVRDMGMGTWWEEGIEHAGMWKRIKVNKQ